MGSAMRLGTAKRAIVIASLATLCGCAGEDAARDMAGTGASLINQFNVETQAFFNAQSALDTAIAQSVSQRKRDTMTVATQNKVQHATWTAESNKKALNIFDAFSANSAATLLSTNIELASLQPISVTPLSPVDPKPFETVVSDLKKLATQPSLQQRASFLFTEGKAVYDGYEKSVKGATAKANNATITQTTGAISGPSK
jgi:hypothetical protein